MENWVKQLAVKERERVAAAQAFNTEAAKFSKGLLAAMKSDLTIFEQEFPKEQVDVGPWHGTNALRAVRSFANSGSAVIISLNPWTRMISCSYEGCPNAARWGAQLELSESGIHFPGQSLDSTVAELSRKILRPLLFPDHELLDP